MFYQKVFFIVFILSGLISQRAVLAQTEPDTLRGQLDEITIEAAYSPITLGQAPMAFSYSVRSAEDLRARPAATMDELTFMMPGISIQNRENYALGERMTIRGMGWRTPFGVRGVQVILDGLPLTEADGQTIMNMIDPAMVRRSELLRGPSATFWGNSSGGVLYLTTIPDAGQPTLQYRGYAGSYNTLKQEARWNVNSGSSQLFGYATYFDTDGYRNHSSATLFRSSIGSRHQLSSNSSLRLIFNYATMPTAQHPGALTDEMLDENPRQARQNFVNSSAGKTFDQAMGGASYLHTFESGSLNLSAHGTYRNLNNPLPFGYIGFDRFGGSTRATYSFHNLPFDLDTGMELRVQYDDRLRTNNVEGERGDEIDLEQQETVLNQAVFARISYQITQRVTFSTGLRADWINFSADGFQVEDEEEEFDGSRRFFSLNPTAGISIRFRDSQYFANFSTSFESPTTTELVNRPGGGSGFNPSINPERTLGIETGIRGRLAEQRIDYDFTIYAMRVKDLLVQFQTEADGQDFFRNEGDSDHYGLEISTSYTAGTGFFTAGAMLNILHASFRNGEFDGNDLPGVPDLRAGLSLTLRPGSQIITAEAEYVDGYATDSGNNSYTDSYFLGHLRWTTKTYHLSENISLSPFLNISNLFDTVYATSVNIDAFGGFFFEPGTGRSVRGGIELNFL